MRKFLVLLIVVSLCLCSCDEAVSVNTGEAENYPIYAEIPEKTKALVINTGSMTLHMPDCRHAARISEKNKLITEYKYIDYFLDRGYNKCKVCFTENTDESNISED